MIAYVEGRLLDVLGNACLIVTDGGVGYEVFLTTPALARLPERKERLGLYTFLVVREDALELYGFSTLDERRMFQILLSVSKVGARTALSVLSTFQPEEVRRIVLEEDVPSLTRVPGLGKKTAQHVFLELKDKLKQEKTPLGSSVSLGMANAGVYRDTVNGLEGLGYTELEVGQMVKTVLRDEPDLDVSEALRAVLKVLAKNKG